MATEEPEAALAGPEYDYTQVLAEAAGLYPGDTVVLTVNGVDVTWARYCYLLSEGLSQYAYYTGGYLPDDYSVQFTDQETLEDYLNAMAL